MGVSSYLFGILLLLPYGFTFCELFTSTAELEEIVETELVLMNALDNYIQVETRKLKFLASYLEKQKKEHDECLKNVSVYLENPVNAYSLIKRLITDWEQIEAAMNENLSKEFADRITSYKEELKFPTAEDMTGAKEGLLRLQQTYNLNVAFFTRRQFEGTKCNSQLTALDYFQIGNLSLYKKRFKSAQLWIQHAYAMLDTEMDESIGKTVVLENLASLAYKQGNVSLALYFTEKLLDILPHDAVSQNKDLYIRLPRNHKTQKKLYVNPYATAMKLYRQLCRGEITFASEYMSKLKCKYVSNDNPFLLIAPFKMEELSLNPKIVLFHDILSNSEIELLKRLSRSIGNFNRATIIDDGTGKIKASQYRIGKVGWLRDNQHKYLEVLNKRISDFSDLSLTTAEFLQVSNYGIGGHFAIHSDYDDVKLKTSWPSGDRIATILFYLSDVVEGGSTVFPFIKLSIPPRKGTAVMWYNLHHFGEGNTNTIHASCPVLFGSKWIATKWIHEFGNEFRKPCELQQ